MARKSKKGTSVWTIRRKRKWKLICRFFRGMPCWLYLVIFLMVFLWCIWPGVIHAWAEPSNTKVKGATYDELAHFGDLFGGLNVLVAAFAFIGFLYALHLQRKDLHLQRGEMVQSRHEMARQTEQFKIQTDALQEQIVEQNRQCSVNIYLNYANKLDSLYDEFNRTHKGEDFTRSIYSLLNCYLCKICSMGYDASKALQAHQTYVTCYYELQLIYIKSLNLVELLFLRKGLTVREAALMLKFMAVSLTLKSKQALNFYLVIEKSIRGDEKSAKRIHKLFGMRNEQYIVASIAQKIDSFRQKYPAQAIPRRDNTELANEFIQSLRSGDIRHFL